MGILRHPPSWLRRLLRKIIGAASWPLCVDTPFDRRVLLGILDAASRPLDPDAPADRQLLLSIIEAASRPLCVDTSADPFHRNFLYFLEEVRKLDERNVLELGARNSTIRDRLNGSKRFVGVDIHPGPGVDVVCDIHELSSALAPLNVRFDAVATISTFEHLAMPWKAVLEINKVMKPGGLLFIATHPTWPPHELPWDFWRFADGAFQGLLNPATGFEIVRCNSGLPCTILPLGTEKSTEGILGQPAFMGISVVARKTADARPGLQWNVATQEILATEYPLKQVTS